MSLFRRRLAVSVLALGLLAAGCGGGDDDEPAVTAPSASGTTTAASAAPSGATIRLGYSAWPGWFPWKVAEEQGFFAKNGVNVKLTYFDSYTDSLTALATGNLDANSQTLNDTLASVSGGDKQTIVLTNDNSTGNDAIIAAPGITSIADLKGKKVAAEAGTVDHFLLLLALKDAGLTEDDVEFTPLLTDAAAAAFVSGQVDAVGVFAPFTTTALGLKGSTVIKSSKDFPGAISDHVAFSTEFIAAHKTEVQGLVSAWYDALDYIKTNRDAAIAIMAKQGGVTPAEYAEYDAGTTLFDKAQNLASFTPGTDATHLDHQAGVLADFLVESKLTDTKPDLTGLLDPSFAMAAAGS